MGSPANVTPSMYSPSRAPVWSTVFHHFPPCSSTRTCAFLHSSAVPPPLSTPNYVTVLPSIGSDQVACVSVFRVPPSFLLLSHSIWGCQAEGCSFDLDF